MTPRKLKQLLAGAEDILQQAVKRLQPHYGNVEFKQKQNTYYDVITRLDTETEDFIAGKLAKLDSSIGFFGEESGRRSTGEFSWLLDPIDGTHHFIRGLPFCSVMLCLVDGKQVLLSTIHHIAGGDWYSAIRGQGARKNCKEKLTVSDRSLHQAQISFEINTEQSAQNGKLYLALDKKTVLIHSITCGWEYSMVAEGKIEGRISKDPWGSIWDFAPGGLLVSEAGGVVANIGSTEYDYKNFNLIATNPTVYKQLTKGKGALFPLKK